MKNPNVWCWENHLNHSVFILLVYPYLLKNNGIFFCVYVDKDERPPPTMLDPKGYPKKMNEESPPEDGTSTDFIPAFYQEATHR